MSNPTRTERTALARALQVGRLTMGPGQGPYFRERHFFPGGLPGGGLRRFGWSPAGTARTAALFVQYSVPTPTWGWGWRPDSLRYRVWSVLNLLVRRWCSV